MNKITIKNLMQYSITLAILITLCRMPIAHAVDAQVLFPENPQEPHNNQGPAAPQPPAPVQQPHGGHNPAPAPVPAPQPPAPIQPHGGHNPAVIHHQPLECCDKCFLGSELCCDIACLGCVATPLAFTCDILARAGSCLARVCERCTSQDCAGQEPLPCCTREALELAITRGHQLRTLISGQMQ